MTTPQLARLPVATVELTDDGVHIDDLVVNDEILAEYLRPFPEHQRPGEIAKILAVGVRGMTTMGAGATVKGVGEEIERVLGAVTAEAETRVKEIIDSGQSVLAQRLDPEVRSSVTARVLGEIESVHRELLERLDLDRTDSHSARLMTELSTLLGPDGLLRERLRETFDPGADDSAMSKLLAAIDARFRDMRDLIVGDRRRAEEAARGTAKGFDYEQDVVEVLRSASGEIGGCTVEATGAVSGDLDARAKVGDAVVTLPDGTRVCVEAKNVTRITLSGKDGILDELDRAMANRKASWAICVSKHDAFPAEVGVFGIYGNRILVTDDGDGVLLRVALRWVRSCVDAARSDAAALDLEAVQGGLDRLRRLAQRFTGAKRALAGVRSGVDQVRGEIDGLRVDLLDLVEELATTLRPRPVK
jgi:hypothetical protein